MERLYGKTIYIGKEPGKGRLLIAVNINGKPVVGAIGNPGSVPASVSRLITAENKSHATLKVERGGLLVLTNAKPQNVTWVDGHEIESKKVTRDSRVELGMDRYPVNPGVIIDSVLKMLSRAVPEKPKEYAIDHLEGVWNEYENGLEQIQLKQQERNKKRMLPMMISTGGVVVGGILSMTGLGMIVGIPVAIASFFFYFRMYKEKDTSVADRKKMQTWLIENYVCPNPECRHFMNTQPYIVLRQNKKCPYCGCRLKENKKH